MCLKYYISNTNLSYLHASPKTMYRVYFRKAQVTALQAKYFYASYPSLRESLKLEVSYFLQCAIIQCTITKRFQSYAIIAQQAGLLSSILSTISIKLQGLYSALLPRIAFNTIQVVSKGVNINLDPSLLVEARN